MNISFKKILITFVTILITFLVFEIISTVYFIQKSGQLVKQSESYEKILESPEKRMLVVGDSTGVGTGVRSIENSTAGRLSKKYPNSTVENYSVNGLRLKGLLEILEPLSDNKYNLILIQVGANDIIKLTTRENIEKRITEVLNITNRMSDNIIFLHSGDVGESTVIPSFARPIFSWRSKIMRDIYLEKDKEFENAHYVDLLKAKEVIDIKDNVEKYNAEDNFHLNDLGYGIWFEVIEKEIDLLNI